MIRFLCLFLLSLAVHADDVTVNLDGVPLPDLVRLTYGEIAKKPYVLTPSIFKDEQLVSLNLQRASTSKVLEHVATVLDGSGYKVMQRSGVFFIDKRQDAEAVTLVYRPRFRSAKYLLDVLNSVLPVKALSVPVVQPPPGGKADILAVDQLVLNVPADKLRQTEKLLLDLDTPSGEVLLKAAIYEVSSKRDEGSALQIALNVSGISASIGSAVVGDSVMIRKGGLQAIITALDRDSRFRSLSRPQLRVKNGSEARFSVGQDVPVLAATIQDRLGNPVQSVEYKPSGIILSVLPEIRSDVIDVKLLQELSSFVATQNGVNGSPTLIKRSVSTQIGLTSGEVAIIAGLQDSRNEDTVSRFPFFGWKLSNTDTAENTEIIIFLEAQRL